MLDMFLDPKSVAIIGAAREPGKLGFAVLDNIIKSGFRGPIYPINPNADQILSKKCYATILAVTEPIDLAVITIPAKSVAKVLDECGQRGVRGVIIIPQASARSAPTGRVWRRT